MQNGQFKMDNPEKLAISGTQHRFNNNNVTDCYLCIYLPRFVSSCTTCGNMNRIQPYLVRYRSYLVCHLVLQQTHHNITELLLKLADDTAYI